MYAEDFELGWKILIEEVKTITANLKKSFLSGPWGIKNIYDKKYMKYNIFYITAILPTSTGNHGYHFGVSSTLFEYYFSSWSFVSTFMNSSVFH